MREREKEVVRAREAERLLNNKRGKKGAYRKTRKGHCASKRKI